MNGILKEGTKEYKAVVRRGCGFYEVSTLDEGYDYDCRHRYVWFCEDCPTHKEQMKKSLRLNRKVKKLFEKMGER